MADKQRREVRIEMPEGVGPHNGTPEYRVTDPQAGDRVGGQVQMLRGCLGHPRAVIAVGRRVGKTTFRPWLWQEEAATTKGIYRAGFIAQDHAKAFEMFEHTIKMWGGDPRSSKSSMVLEVVGDAKSQRRFIRTIPVMHVGAEAVNEGMEIHCWSGAHPHYEKIRGYMKHFDRISVDEPSLLHRKLLNVVNPMLMDSGGSLDATGTPDVDGIGNDWFQTYFNKGLDPTEPNWWCMNAPSMSNPLLTPEAIDQLKSDCLTEDDWLQEGLAQFLTARGAVYTRLSDVFVLEPREKLPEWFYRFYREIYDGSAYSDGSGLHAWTFSDPIPNHRYVMSVDWARVRDATAVSIIDATTMEQHALVLSRSDDYEEQVEWVKRLHELYNSARIHSDANGVGDAMTRTLQRRYQEGCIGHKFGADKGSYVRHSQMLFAGAEIKLINCPVQRNEFMVYRREKSEATGRVSYSHPPHGNDDTVDALLMMAEDLRGGARAPFVPPKDPPKMFSLDWLKAQRRRRKIAAQLRRSQI